MLFATLANFLMPSSQIFPPTPFPDSLGTRSPSFTAAFGSNATSRKEETTIFRNRLSGMSSTAFGGRISSPMARTGGLHFIRQTICSGPLVLRAMGATPSITTSVGCERCHGPGSEHVQHPTRGNILNAARMEYVQASDTCIQCHPQGRPLTNPIEGRYYDWPVGYQVGSNLRDFWQLEEHTLGEMTFTHYPDGTAHKNRMQGNDFVQSVMYRRGVTCFSCHDVHGTEHNAQLRKPADQLCLDCHGPLSMNGPRTGTL